MDKTKNLYRLYEALKEQDFDVPDTYDSFERTLCAPGKTGVDRRVKLYGALKSQDFDVPDTYESFSRTLFAPVKQAKQEQSKKQLSKVEWAPKPTPTQPATPQPGVKAPTPSAPPAPKADKPKVKSEDIPGWQDLSGHLTAQPPKATVQKTVEHAPLKPTYKTVEQVPNSPVKPVAKPAEDAPLKVKPTEELVKPDKDTQRYIRMRRGGTDFMITPEELEGKYGGLQGIAANDPEGSVRVYMEGKNDKGQWQLTHVPLARVNEHLNDDNWRIYSVDETQAKVSTEDAYESVKNAKTVDKMRKAGYNPDNQWDVQQYDIEERLRKNEQKLKAIYAERERKRQEKTGFVEMIGDAFREGNVRARGLEALAPDDYKGPHDKQAADLLAEQEMLQDALTKVKAQRSLKKSDGAWGGFFDLNNLTNAKAGFIDKLKDPKLYSFGTIDLHNADRMMRIKNKVDRNEELSDTELDLVVSAITKNAVDGSVDLPGGYKAGGTSAEMFKFIAEMMANPANGVAKAMILKYGRGILKRLPGKLAQRLVKAGIATADDIVSSVGLATTIQGAGALADIKSRMTGEATFDFNGRPVFTGGKSAGRAAYEGIASKSIENYTERLGEHFAPLGKWVAKHVGAGTKGVAKAIGAGGFYDSMVKQLNALNSTKAAKMFADFEARAQYHGVGGEMLEEEAGIPLNAILVGDNSISDLVDPEQQIDIALGCLYGQIMMGSLGGATHIYGAASSNRRLKKAERKGKALFGDRWQTISNQLATVDDADLPKAVVGISKINETGVKDKAAVKEQDKALLEYAQALVEGRAYHLAQLQKRSEAQPGSMMDAAQEAYLNGREATPQERADIEANWVAAGDALERNGGLMLRIKIDEDPNAAIQYINDNPDKFTQRHKELAVDYLNARVARDGMRHKQAEDMDEAIEDSNYQVDGITNRSTGLIQQASIGADGKSHYVISGKIEVGQDGNIDRNNSDQDIIVQDVETGESRFASINEVSAVSVGVNPDGEKQARAQAIKDAHQQDFIDRINGKLDLNDGDKVKLLDGKGNVVEATVQGQVIDQSTGQPVDNTFTVDFPNGDRLFMSREDIETQSKNARRIEAEARHRRAKRSQRPAPQPKAPQEFARSRKFKLQDEQGNLIDATVIEEADSDGLIQVQTSAPINGKTVGMYTADQLNAMMAQDETQANPETGADTPEATVDAEQTSDVSVQQEEAPQESATQESQEQQQPQAQGEADEQSVQQSAHQPTQQSAQPSTQQPAQQSGQQPAEGGAPMEASPLSRVPRKENGKPDYVAVEPEVAWDAMVEASNGEEAKATNLVNGYIKFAKAALDKAKRAKIAETDDIDAYAEAEAQRQEAIDRAQAQLDAWQRIADEPARRANMAQEQARAEAQRQADEAKAQARAEAEATRAQQEAEAKAQAEAERQKREALNGVPDMVDDSPADARARGYRRTGSAKVDRQQPIANKAEGATAEVKFSDKAIETGKRTIIEASELQPSHVDGQRNPAHFIDEAQPKERKDGASRLAASKMASNIRPEEITGGATAYTGSPCVNSRGEAIQGNNRSTALRLMYESNPEQAQAYKEWLMEHAEEFGMTREQVAQFKQPVLVNMFDVTDERAIELGQSTASDTESGGEERIRPKNLMKKLGSDIKGFAATLLRSEDEDASISELAQKNGATVLKWLNERGHITNTQYQSAFDSKGNLKEGAIADLKGVLYHSIFEGAPTTLEERFNQLPAKAQRAILATMYRDFSSPVEQRVRKEVQQAIMAYDALRFDHRFAKATNITEALKAMDEWSKQMAFDEVSGEAFLPSESFSNFALHLAAMMKGMTQKGLQSSLNEMFDIIQGTQKPDLFGEVDNTPKTLAEAISKVFNIEYKPLKTKDNGNDGSSVLAGHSEDGEAGRRGSTGTLERGERTEAGAEPADGGRRADSSGEQELTAEEPVVREEQSGETTPDVTEQKVADEVDTREAEKPAEGIQRGEAESREEVNAEAKVGENSPVTANDEAVSDNTSSAKGNNKSEERFSINESEEATDAADRIDLDADGRLKDTEELLRARGIKVHYYMGDPQEQGRYENGEVWINLRGNKSAKFVMGHELGHGLEEALKDSPEVLAACNKAAEDYMREKLGAQGYDELHKAKKKAYISFFVNKKGLTLEEAQEKVTDDYVDKEMRSDALGDILEDKNAARVFFNGIKDRSLLRKIYDAIAGVINDIMGRMRHGSEKWKAMRKAAQNFAEAYKRADMGAEIHDNIMEESRYSVSGAVIGIGGEARFSIGHEKTPVAGLPNRANEKQASGSVLQRAIGDSSSNPSVPAEAKTKITQNTLSTKNKIRNFLNGDFKIDTSALPSTLRGLGKLFNLENKGGSRYAVLRTDGGQTVALRLSDHGANGNNFAQDGANSNLSIVIERRRFDAKDSDVEYTEATIPMSVYEANGKAVVEAIVKGVDAVLADKPFELDESLGTVETKGGQKPSAQFNAAMQEIEAESTVASEVTQTVYDVAKGLVEASGIEVAEVSNEQAMQMAELADPDIKLMGSRTERKKQAVADYYSNKRLDENERAVVNVFSGKEDNLVIACQREDGIRKVILRQGSENKAGTTHSLFRHLDAESNAISIDEIQLIPEVISKGERSINEDKVVYDYSTQSGVRLRVCTEIRPNGREVFTNFYSNKKSQSSDYRRPLTGNTQSSAQTSETELVSTNVQNNTVSDKPNFHRTFHGSAADFDAFDHSYMGSGEGAQAYGWGSYVTEVEGIAKEYASAIALNKYTPWAIINIDDLRNDPDLKDKPYREDIINAVEKTNGDLDYIVEFGLPGFGWLSNPNANEMMDWIQRKADEIRPKPMQGRNLYTVEIPDDNGKNYIQWDEPFSPSLVDELQGTISNEQFEEWLSLRSNNLNAPYGGFSERNDYKTLSAALGSQKDASSILSKLGYVGIKYPAQYLSGGRKDGAQNYVIFNEGDLKITDHVQFLRDGQGVVYGWTVGGKVYLNKDAMNPDTPVHEYTHLWDEMVQKKNPALWKRGVELMKQTPLWEKVANDPAYAHLNGNENAIASEVHSRLTGQKAAETLEEMIDSAKGITEKAARISLVERIKGWLREMFKELKATLSEWSGKDLDALTVEDFVNMTLRDLAEGMNPNKHRDATRGDGVRFSAAMSSGKAEFDAVREQAVKDKGTVMPGLRDKKVRVVEVPWHDWISNRPIGEAKTWAKEAFKRDLYLYDSRNKKIAYLISGKAINKFLSESATKKTEDLRVHLSILKALPEVIENGIEAEVHADYLKGSDGTRNVDNGYDPNRLIHRFYSAVELDGKTYRVKTTFIEDNSDSSKRPHSYEAEKIEVIMDESTTTSSGAQAPKSNTVRTLEVTKLLEGVEKSYDKGKKLLDESADLSDGELNPSENSEEQLSYKANEDNLRFRTIEDEAQIEELEGGETIKVYRAMQLIDGKLLPPMSARVAGKLREGTELGQWEESEENPDMATDDGYFVLDKGNGSTIKARYNPYFHTSLSPINDQFSSAWDRPNIVIVEVEIPKSELTSGYKAYKAKDAVGEVEWKSGPVSGKLAKMGDRRRVFLSRYCKPVRIVPMEEVAQEYAKRLNGRGISVPFNTVPPALRDALVEAGVEISAPQKGNAGDAAKGAYEQWLAENGEVAATRKATPEAMTEKAQELAEKLGVDVEVVSDPAEVTGWKNGRKRKAKGWFDAKTGKVVVVVPNHASVADVEATVFHEVVGHKGLRKLIGEEKFNDFLDSVFEHAKNGIRISIMDNVKRQLFAEQRCLVKERLVSQGVAVSTEAEAWVASDQETKDWAKAEAEKKRDAFRRIATEEYMSEMAERIGEGGFEKMDADEKTLWGKIRERVMQLLDIVMKGLGMNSRIKLTNEDIAYILYKSWKNLRNGGKESLADQVADIAMRERTGYGRQVDDDILFRDGEMRDRVSARDRYEERMSKGSVQAAEAFQDSMRSLLELYKAIEVEGKGMKARDFRIEDIASYENAYTAENAMSSTTFAQTQKFHKDYMVPITEAVNALGGKTETGYKDVTRYMMAKHGLERNEYMRNQAIANDQDADRDFAGLTGLTGESDVATAELVAQKIVDDFEKAHKGLVNDLWQAVNTANQAILDKQYEGGLVSEAAYNKASSMYKHYIPLRGWEETTSDEVYNYLTDSYSGRGNVIKTATGRSSVADDPIATMGMMAEDSIRQANRNVMKQRFLNYVLNNPSDLVSVNKLWLKHEDVTDTWQPIFVDIDPNDTPEQIEQKTNDFYSRVEQLAQQQPGKYMCGRDAINIPFKVIPGKHGEHQVIVKRGGEAYVLTINGNPRAAQALNGLTNPDVEVQGAVGKALRGIEKVNRLMATGYTTRNPNFVLSNFIRDALFSNSMVWIKESPAYAAKFNANFVKSFGQTYKLFKKWENGTLSFSIPEEKMFYDFMMHGGETGFTAIRNIEKHKQYIAKEIKRQNSSWRRNLRLIGLQLDIISRTVENMARFAAFRTSRGMGRDVGRSVWDAKEISVNFNKKGAGAKMLDGVGQTRLGNAAAWISGTGRLSYIFWNAGIQGLTNITKAHGRNPIKALSAMAAMFAAGYFLAMAGSWDDDDEDEESKYYDLPSYARRSNACFRVGNYWAKIPLPVEYRAIYGLGELAYSYASGKENMTREELAKEMLSQMSQVLPIDFMDGGGANAYVPSGLRPIVDAQTNKSWVGLPIYKENPYNENLPEWQKAYKSTGGAYVWASKQLSKLGGGDDYKRGSDWSEWNPAKVEYVVNGYLGGLASFPTQLVKTAMMVTGDREVNVASIPFANRVLMQSDERTAGRKVNNDFYKYMEEYEETKRLLKGYEKSAGQGVTDYAQKLAELSRTPEFERYWVIDGYKRDLNRLHRYKKDATSQKELDKIQKDEFAIRKEIVNKIQGKQEMKPGDVTGIKNAQKYYDSKLER